MTNPLKLLGYAILALFSVAGRAETSSVRCAIDLGSGSTKIKVAAVEPNAHKLVQVIYEGDKKTSFSLSLNSRHEMPDAMVTQGIAAIHALKHAAKLQMEATVKRGVASVWPSEKQALDCRAVARDAFRQAENRVAVLERIQKETGVPVRLLTQDEEAVMGTLAASISLSSLLHTQYSPLDLAVWDIGGANQQITLLRPGVPSNSPERFLIYKNELGPENLKKYLIENIQKRKANSPNPMTRGEIEEAVAYVKSVAARVNPEMEKRLHDPGMGMVGIGAVHGKSMSRPLHLATGVPYTQEQIHKALMERAAFIDEQIGGTYADTQLVSLILVLGFMQQLGVHQVVPMDINLTQAILVDPEMWRTLSF